MRHCALILVLLIMAICTGCKKSDSTEHLPPHWVIEIRNVTTSYIAQITFTQVGSPDGIDSLPNMVGPNESHNIGYIAGLSDTDTGQYMLVTFIGPASWYETSLTPVLGVKLYVDVQLTGTVVTGYEPLP
jgi:hypothetical protein